MNKKTKNNLFIAIILIVLAVLVGHFGLNLFSISDYSYCDDKGVCLDKAYYSTDDSQIGILFTKNTVPAYGFYVKEYIDGSLIQTVDSKAFVQDCVNSNNVDAGTQFISQIPAAKLTDLSSGMHKLSLFVGEKPVKTGVNTQLYCLADSISSPSLGVGVCPLGVYLQNGTNVYGARVTCQTSASYSQIQYTFAYSGQEFDQVNNTNFVLIEDRNIDFINRTVPPTPPLTNPSFDLNLWFSSVWSNILAWLQGLF